MGDLKHCMSLSRVSPALRDEIETRAAKTTPLEAVNALLEQYRKAQTALFKELGDQKAAGKELGQKTLFDKHASPASNDAENRAELYSFADPMFALLAYGGWQALKARRSGKSPAGQLYRYFTHTLLEDLKLTGRASPTAQAVVAAGIRTVNKTRELMGQTSPAVRTLGRLLGFRSAFSKESRAAWNELLQFPPKISETQTGFENKLAVAVEGRMPLSDLSPKAQEIVKALRAVIRESGLLMEQVGARIKVPADQVRGISLDEIKNRFSAIATKFEKIGSSANDIRALVRKAREDFRLELVSELGVTQSEASRILRHFESGQDVKTLKIRMTAARATAQGVLDGPDSSKSGNEKVEISPEKFKFDFGSFQKDLEAMPEQVESEHYTLKKMRSELTNEQQNAFDRLMAEAGLTERDAARLSLALRKGKDISKLNVWAPFKAGKGDKITRQMTPDGWDMLDGGDPKARAAFYGAIAEMNRLDPKVVQDAFEEGAKDADVTAVIRRGPVEAMRMFDRWPTHVLFDGKMIEVTQSSPDRIAQSAVRQLASRAAYISEFGQDLLGGVTAEMSPIVDQIKREAGTAVADSAVRVLRTLNGMPEANADFRTPDGGFMWGVQSAVNLTKAMALSTAPIANLVEPFGTLGVVGGYGRLLGGLTDMLKFDTDGALTLARAQGAVGEHITAWHLRPKRALFDATRLILKAAGSPNAAVNSMNEVWSGQVGLRMVEALRTGRGQGAGMKLSLRLLAFTDEEVAALQDGTASEALYGQIPGRLVAFSQGTTNLTPEQARALNNRFVRGWTAFQAWPLMQINRTGRVWETVRTSFKEHPVAATALFAKYFGIKTATGAASILLRALIFGGVGGLLDKLEQIGEESKEKGVPWRFLADSVFQSGLGAYSDALLRASESPSLFRATGDTISRFLYPVGLAYDAITAYYGMDRYKDLDALDRFRLFIQSRTPILKTVMFANAQGEDTPRLRAAISAYWALRRELDTLPAAAGEDTSPAAFARYRSEMKKAMMAFKEGKTDEANAAIARAFQTKEGKSIQETFTDVRASLAARTLLKEDPKSGLDAKKLAQLKQRLGDGALSEIQRWDDSIQQYISSLTVRLGREGRPKVPHMDREKDTPEEIQRMLSTLYSTEGLSSEKLARESISLTLFRKATEDQESLTVPQRYAAAEAQKVLDAIFQGIDLIQRDKTLSAPERVQRLTQAREDIEKAAQTGLKLLEEAGGSAKPRPTE
jgi:hypothetical protein